MDTGKQNTRGSLFNQKYFDGYTRRITLRDGRLRSQFVYEGTVYTPRAGAPAWRRAKGFCLLLWAAHTALLLAALAQKIPANRMRGVAALGAAAVLCALGLAALTALRLMTGTRLTQWEYRMAAVSLKELAGLAAVFALALACCAAFVPAATGTEFSPAALACALGSGAAALAEVRLLAAERYDAAPSEERPSGIDLTADFERGN